MRTFMDLYQLRPKCLVGNMAFHSPSWQAFYGHHGIKAISLGARTPWPNRAETAVRLFKRTLSVLAVSALADPDLKTMKVTAKDLVRITVWARNTQLTIGGKTPIELAFGRRPPDLIQSETADPAQLSDSLDEPHWRDQVISAWPRRLTLRLSRPAVSEMT